MVNNSTIGGYLNYIVVLIIGQVNFLGKIDFIGVESVLTVNFKGVIEEKIYEIYFSYRDISICFALDT